MKMTQPLWRTVALWICVASVSRCGGFLVEGAGSRPEAHTPALSLTSVPGDTSDENTHYQNNVQSWGSPVQSGSESDQPTAQENGRNTHEVETNQHEQVQISDPEESSEAVQPRSEDLVLKLEQTSEGPKPLPSQDQDSPLGSPALPSAVEKDDPSSFSAQDTEPERVSSVSSEVVVTEGDSDLLHEDCTDEEEEENPYDGDSPPMVLENTSNVHTTGTKIHSEPAAASPAVHGDTHQDPNTSRTPTEPDPSSRVGAEPESSGGGGKDPEDIPTFDEWKRKMMEVEKEKTLSTPTSNNGGSPGTKKVQKNFNNYASVECGAKLLGANPEAKSTSAILKENMDLYMLNPCSTKIWFVIELCERIQVKQLDIANFELFSSTPKDFLVSISDRYPTNKWLKLGTFHARDERTVQSFPLDEHHYAKYVKMFTKYIKVELISHFGSEHFCPLSLIRVFGTSMVEEYETYDIDYPPERTDEQEDDLDSTGVAGGEAKSSENPIKDAILNMVNNIANNVLGGNAELRDNSTSQEENVTEPSQEVAEETGEGEPPSVSPIGDNPIPAEPDVRMDPPPSSETDLRETPTADAEERNNVQLVEETLDIPSKEGEVKPTVILLGKEDELEEDKEPIPHQEESPEEPIISAQLPSPSPPRSCVISLREHVQKQCPAKQERCQTEDPEMGSSSDLIPGGGSLTSEETPPADLQPSLKVENQPPDGKDPSGERPVQESEVLVSEAPVSSEVQPLEPSLTSGFSTATAQPSLAVETPPLSHEGSQGGPRSSQDSSVEETPAASGGSAHMRPTVSESTIDPSTAMMETKADSKTSPTETVTLDSMETKTGHFPVFPPPFPPPFECQPEVPVAPDASLTAPESGADHSPTDRDTDQIWPTPNGHLSPTLSPDPSVPPSSPVLSDIYAEPFNVTEQNGNPVHGSSQKESVFMRLNNRIKALEVNMSLSGRYLEQLSQRYRKQMEEMQRAFNKTIIKLQNTSRVAEEQDLRQSESIQLLQSQLENVTQLVLNLSVKVSELHEQVSDRQSYLLLSLTLFVSLGLLLCVNHCRVTAPAIPEPEPPDPKSYSSCTPDSSSTDGVLPSGDAGGLKRSVSYPLLNSDSLQLLTSEDTEMLHSEDPQGVYPPNRKRKRRRLKQQDKVETLKPSLAAAPAPAAAVAQPLCNGTVSASRAPVTAAPPAVLTKPFLLPTFRDSPSEGSSEGSSHSDEPSFCGVGAACPRICDALPPPNTCADKRAPRRRRPKPHGGGGGTTGTAEDMTRKKHGPRALLALPGAV